MYRQLLLSLCLVSTAHADTPERELEAMGKDLADVAPLPHREKVAPRPPPWCSGVKLTGTWGPHSIGRNIAAADRDWKHLLVAARVTCQWPDHPATQRAVAAIAQHWVNYTGLPAAGAFEALALRLDGDRFAADQKQLCGGLTVSDEIAGGEDHAFTRARRVLLGCAEQPMWLDPTQSIPDATFDYVDASAGELDPAVQLALVLQTTRRVFEPRSTAFDRDLLTYGTLRPDTQLIAKARLADLADRAPYQGNTYARAVLLESLYRGKLAIAEIERELAKRDADWKQLVVTAPERAITEWTAAAAKHADALARSHAFERAFWGPSRKAVKGCWATLRPDFIAVIKQLPHGTTQELLQAMSAPVPSLLLSRLVACGAIDHPRPEYIQILAGAAARSRPSRGPRLAAYHAVVEALGAVVADRPRFPVEVSSLRDARGLALLAAAAREIRAGQGFAGSDGTGTVKAVKKVAAGLEVTFVTQKAQVPNIVCVGTNKIWRIESDGRVVYYQSCTNHGLKWIDRTPEPVTVPTEWAGGIAPGAVVQFQAMVGHPPGRIALPYSVYAGKGAKQVVNALGFGL